MTKILFVCHGNICRSPMGEMVLKDMARKAGLADRYEIDSAAVSTEEIGNRVYPPARRALEAHGVACGDHRARQITRADLDRYEIDSAAVSTEEIGNRVYPPARRALEAHGVACGDHRARQITRADLERFDRIYYMDRSNARYLERMFPGDHRARQITRADLERFDRIYYMDRSNARYLERMFPGVWQEKCRPLLDWDVADPWYTGDFEATWQDITAGCRRIMEETQC